MRPRDATTLEEPAEGAGAFGGFIGPRTLVAQVRSAAPFLFDGTHPLRTSLPRNAGARLHEHGAHPLGWWSILLESDLLRAAEAPTPEARTDYFALCLSAHFASVATYVPTDVDAKIRDALWFEGAPPSELRRMRDLALGLATWDVRAVSARIVEVDGIGPVSGHDGERLSVLCGGLLGLLAAGDREGAALFESAIDAELDREARAFAALERRPGRERELLLLAAVLAHNAGDVNQGLSAKGGRAIAAIERARFADLARERFDRYGGAFGRAGALYRELMAPEGHRHYPLRRIRLLRRSPELLLPLGPFLDDWGGRLARHPAWDAAQRAEVVGGLVEGFRKVPGSESYARAMAGFDAAHPGGIGAREIEARFTTATRRGLKSPDLRRRMAVRRESFEGSYGKRARAVLAAWSPA